MLILTVLRIYFTSLFLMLCQDTAKCLIEDDTFYTMSLLKKGASKGYAPRSLQCCICNCSFKSSSGSGIRVFNCGHAAHQQCDVQENVMTSQSSSGGCPICVHKKKIQKSKGKMAEQGLVSASPSTSRRAQGTSFLHPHELDVFENSTGPQISRVCTLSLFVLSTSFLILILLYFYMILELSKLKLKWLSQISPCNCGSIHHGKSRFTKQLQWPLDMIFYNPRLVSTLEINKPHSKVPTIMQLVLFSLKHIVHLNLCYKTHPRKTILI